MNQLPSSMAGREILWNVSHPLNSIVMYALLTLASLICGAALLNRFFIWSAGRPDAARSGHWLDRFERIWNQVLLQKGVRKEREPGRMHTLIAFGFMVLLFTTTMVFLDHDLGFEIYRGSFYLAVTILSDLFGVALLLGILLAYHRRYVQRIDRLHSTRSDGFLLGSLALLVVQGYLLEGLRIRATNDPWQMYSPVGALVSTMFWSLSEDSLRVLHFVIWWAHASTVFLCIALLPYTKFLHILTSSANLFFRDFSRPKGAFRYPGDIEKLMEEALSDEANGEFRIGVSSIEDLTWKQRLDLDACTSCGRCQDVCPAYRSGKILSPKWLILDTRNHMLELEASGKTKPSTGLWQRFRELDGSLLHSMLLKRFDDLPRTSDGHLLDTTRAANKLVQQSAIHIGESLEHKLAGEVMDEDVFWSCTTCRACMEVCPVGIEHVDLIMDARRSMALMDGNIPSEAQSSLRAIETRGNPFGPANDRANWSEGLNVPIVSPGDSVDILYWVGCISAYDKRKQKIARSMAMILNASGLRWGILGNSENCTGDPARRLGEENLYQTMAKKNGALLSGIKFNTIVANCPHCFNTIKNEYPAATENGISQSPFEVIHHSELIHRLLESKKLTLKDSEAPLDLTFHDPCYLGRYNETYDAPREVLVQLGGSKLREMKDSRERGLCCGAGGGHYWFDMKVGDRVNVLRINQAAETGASVVATGCPFCLQMMEDGAKLTNREETLIVRDIAELVAERL